MSTTPFAIPSVSHDPNEQLDYETNWRSTTDPVLEVGEDISSSVWAIDGMRTSSRGSTVTSDGACTVLSGGSFSPSVSGDIAKCWVAGGTLGAQYLLRNRITTNSTPSRTHDRSRWLVIEVH